MKSKCCRVSTLLPGLAIYSILSAFGSTDANAQTNVGFVAANRSLTIEVCDGITDPNNYPRYIHYTLLGTGYSWSVNGVPNPTGALPIGANMSNFPTGVHCMNAQVTTSGIPSTGYPNPTGGRGIRFLGCIVYPATGATCNGQFREYTFVNTTGGSTPSLSPSSPITTEGSRPITVTLNPPFAATTVNASCTQVNGAQINVTPSTLQTNISGKAVFTVNTPVLNVPAPPGIPSGVCTFTVPTYGTSANLQVQGTAQNVSITLAPQVIMVAGSASITASTFPFLASSPVTIDATCNSTLAQVTVSPSSRVTDALGKAVFSISASGLVNINPNLSIKPSAYCNFTVRNSSSQVLSFTTANACAFSDLVPRPALCGNP